MNAFFDIDILLVAPDDWSENQKKEAVQALHAAQSDPDSVKCCMVNKVLPYMYGFARIIYY